MIATVYIGVSHMLILLGFILGALLFGWIGYLAGYSRGQRDGYRTARDARKAKREQVADSMEWRAEVPEEY